MYAFLVIEKRRGVAQLVARLVRDQEVVGSNPVASTKNSRITIGGTAVLILRFCDGIRGWEPFYESKTLCQSKFL